MAKSGPKPRPVEERFWPKVHKTDTCWLWIGRTNRGYGIFDVGSTPMHGVMAHRFAYELLVGPISDGLTIDHVKANGCTSTACVKAIADEYGPAHLEPVTMRENLMRGTGWPAKKVAQTHCYRGHEFTEANTMYVPSRPTSRRCRQCKRDYQAKRRMQGLSA